MIHTTSGASVTRIGSRSRDALPPLMAVGRPLPPWRRIIGRRLAPMEDNEDDDDDETESDNDDHSEDSDEDDYVDVPKVSARSRPSRKGSISPKRKQRAQQRTDKVLTFLQNARKLNIPVRAGKWNEEEDNYLRKLVRLFNQGVLDDIEEKTSMRSWLSKMLNCCPMRISKKQMHGEPFKGKAKYKRCRDRVDKMGQDEYTNSYNEIHRLRANFLKHWAREEFGRWNTSDRAVGFETWYNKVMTTVPEPKIAVNKRIKVPVMNDLPSALQLMEDHVQTPLPSLKKVYKSTPAKRPRLASMTLDTTSPKPKLLRLEPSTVSSTSSRCDDNSCTMPSCACASPLVLMTEEPTANFDFDIGLALYEEDDLELMQLVMSESTDPADDLYCREVLSPEPASPKCDALILDFGPPSMWNCDPLVTSNGSPTSNDDFLVDEDLASTDPSLLTPYELPTGSWLQSVQAACMITPF